jgi:hypothetical protein
MPTASGLFDVKRTPITDPEGEPTLGRFRLDKRFHGALDATSKGMMLAMGNPSGSAGYVAMELVTGTLDGRKGSFALMHSGTMARGKPTLSVSVVPDSGTDELTGLSGLLAIEITDGKHHYAFDYTIDATPA